MRIEATVRGSSVTVVECRPLWRADPTEWSKVPVAQLRLVPVVLDDVRRHLRAVKDRLWPRRGSTPVRAVLRTWQPGPRICSAEGSAALRDHLRYRRISQLAGYVGRT